MNFKCPSKMKICETLIPLFFKLLIEFIVAAREVVHPASFRIKI